MSSKAAAKRPAGLPRMAPSKQTVKMPPPPPETDAEREARQQREAEMRSALMRSQNHDENSDNTDGGGGGRRKAVKSGVAKNRAAFESVYETPSVPQWGDIDESDRPKPSLQQQQQQNSSTTNTAHVLDVSIRPSSTSAALRGEKYAGEARQPVDIPTGRYEKKYVYGSVTVVSCGGLINRTTSNTVVQTNPFVEIYDNNPKTIGGEEEAKGTRKKPARDDAEEDDAGAPPLIQPILLTPVLRSTINPTFDFESSTVNFKILTTGHLTVQVRHREVNKTMQRANGFQSSTGIPNNKYKAVPTTRGVVDKNKVAVLDSFLGEVKITGADIAKWLAEAGAPSPVRRVNRDTSVEEDDESFTVHHADLGQPKPLKATVSTTSPQRRNKALAPTNTRGRNKSVPLSAAEHAHGEGGGTYKLTLPLAPRHKEDNASVKASFAQNELGSITLLLGPPVEGYDGGDAATSGKDTKEKRRGSLKGKVAIPDDEKVDGYLTVIGGENMLKRDVGDNAQSDPYVIVYYPSEDNPVYRSETAQCTLHPRWSTIEEIPIDRDNDKATIIIDAWNDNPRPERDNFLGRVLMRASELPLTDDPTFKVPLAPRAKERDGDIARLSGRLGSLILSWRIRKGATTSVAAAAAPTTLPAASTTNNPPRPDRASRVSEASFASARIRIPSAPAQPTPLATGTGTKQKDEKVATRERVPTMTTKNDPILTKDSRKEATVVERGDYDYEAGEDVYIAPPLNANPFATVSRPGRAPSRNKASGAVGGENEKSEPSVAPLDPAAIHSLMSTLNASQAGMNLQQLMSQQLKSTTASEQPLPKHRSMFFTAEDYAKYGLTHQPTVANSASPKSTSVAPKSNLTNATYGDDRDGLYWREPTSSRGPVGGDFRREPCGHKGWSGIDAVCEECRWYGGGAAMPPMGQLHRPPPPGSVVGETAISVPLTMTDVIPIRLTDDYGNETHIKARLDEPNLKPLLASAERCFNIHPASAMLLFCGEMLNPMLSLRGNGVLLLKGEGAVDIKVKMFKGQRVNVIIKAKKGPRGSSSNPHSVNAEPREEDLFYVGNSSADGTVRGDATSTPFYVHNSSYKTNNNSNSPYVYIPLAIDSEWTIRDLKKMLATHVRCPPQCEDPSFYHLYWRYNRLVDTMTVDYYHLPNGSELEVHPKESEVLHRAGEEEVARYTYLTEVNEREQTRGRPDDRFDDFHEEDLIGIPRHKTALELRRERRNGRGSAMSTSATSRSESARKDVKSRAASRGDSKPRTGPITTVTRRSGQSNVQYSGAVGEGKATEATANALRFADPHRNVALGGGPIAPLGAPELAIGANGDGNKLGGDRDSFYHVPNSLEVGRDNSIQGQRQSAAEPNNTNNNGNGQRQTAGSWGSASYSASYAKSLAKDGTNNNGSNIRRPEWDDRKSTEFQPNARFPSPSTTQQKTVLGGRATATIRPAGALPTSPLRVTSPSSQSQRCSSPTRRPLTAEELAEATDIRPGDWRSTLRTDGRRNMHVRMRRDGEERQTGGNGENEEYSYSYSVRPLPEGTVVNRVSTSSNSASAANTHRPMSPSKAAELRAANGELIYGVTSDRPKPIYGNDYSVISEYNRELTAQRNSENGIGGGSVVYPTTNTHSYSPFTAVANDAATRPFTPLRGQQRPASPSYDLHPVSQSYAPYYSDLRPSSSSAAPMPPVVVLEPHTTTFDDRLDGAGVNHRVDGVYHTRNVGSRFVDDRQPTTATEAAVPSFTSAIPSPATPQYLPSLQTSGPSYMYSALRSSDGVEATNPYVHYPTPGHSTSSGGDGVYHTGLGRLGSQPTMLHHHSSTVPSPSYSTVTASPSAASARRTQVR